jgi:hypothetical protein
VNEVAEYDGSGNRSRTYVHGISYVDERLMMHDDTTSRPYYCAVNRMYDVVMLIDRAGSIVERYCYDAYGTEKGTLWFYDKDRKGDIVVLR